MIKNSIQKIEFFVTLEDMDIFFMIVVFLVAAYAFKKYA